MADKNERKILPNTEETVMMLARGTAIHTFAGQVIPHKLKAFEQAEFDRAKERGFLLRKGTRPNLENVWYSWCEVTNKPYITVKTRGKYATVMYDLIASPEKLTDEGIKALQAIYRDWPYRHLSQVHAGSITGDFRVSAEESSNVAKNVLQLILADWSIQESNKKETT